MTLEYFKPKIEFGNQKLRDDSYELENEGN